MDNSTMLTAVHAADDGAQERHYHESQNHGLSHNYVLSHDEMESLSQDLSAEPSAAPWDNGHIALTRRRKKPRGMPKRPLSAYNLFFKAQRPNVLSSGNREGERVGFANLAKIIGKQWKSIEESERRLYDRLANEDNARYRAEMDAYSRWKQEQRLTAKDDESNIAGEIEREQPDQETAVPRQQHFDVEMNDPPTVSGFPFSLRTPLRAWLPGTPETCSHYNQTGHADHYRTQFRHSTSEHASDDPPSYPPYHPQLNLPLAYSGAPYPIPTGLSVLLTDGMGDQRLYSVEYKFYTMTRAAAEKYLSSLQGATSHATGSHSQAKHQPEPPRQVAVEENQETYQQIEHHFQFYHPHPADSYAQGHY
jgi:hypothetical protein